jgi:hypothetical protein
VKHCGSNALQWQELKACGAGQQMIMFGSLQLNWLFFSDACQAPLHPCCHTSSLARCSAHQLVMCYMHELSQLTNELFCSGLMALHHCWVNIVFPTDDPVGCHGAPGKLKLIA